MTAAENFGLLGLPGRTDDDPVGDPLLRVILSFARAVINADARDAWGKLRPSDQDAVAHTFPHDPDPASFSAKRTPALYAWRGDTTGSTIGVFSQGYIADRTVINLLWVPPTATQNNERVRQAFPNLVRKSLLLAFTQGRHPAWKVAGDTYFNPDEYGSVLVRQAKCAQLKLATMRAYDLIVDGADNKSKTTYESILFTIEPIELAERNPLRHGVPQTQQQTTLRIGSDVAALLDLQEAHFDLALASLSPSSGTGAGGTVVTLTGSQFEDGMQVLFGTALASDVTFIDESTITATTPAGVSVVDVTVQTSADSAKLVGAFTFT